MFDQVNHPPGLTWPNSQHYVWKIVCFEGCHRRMDCILRWPRKMIFRWILMDLEGYIILRGICGSFDRFQIDRWSFDQSIWSFDQTSCDGYIYTHVMCSHHWVSVRESVSELSLVESVFSVWSRAVTVSTEIQEKTLISRVSTFLFVACVLI